MRLTTYIREDIRDKALKHKFAPIIAELVARSAALAVECYERLYTEEERKKMAALPDGWLKTDDEIDVNVGGQGHTLEFNGKIRIWSTIHKVTPKEVLDLTDIRKRFLAKHHDMRHALALPATDELGHRVSALSQEWMDLETEINNLERKTMAALRKVTTAKKLIETWPEIARFVDYDLPAPVPAIPIETLNAELGLVTA